MAELLSLSTLIVCFIAILCVTKFFGKEGLYAYSTVAIITANIQVLKLTEYSFAPDPVALGTVLFATTFAVDNILNEYFGAKSAKKSVWISFFMYAFFMLLMNIVILHPVVRHTECVNLHEEIRRLFSPTLTLLVASLASYVVGQYTDITVFSLLKKAFKNKQLSLRSMISMAASSFVDNVVFSLLAWVILADKPISLSSLWSTYIFITYLIRLIIAILCVPLVKLSGKFVENRNV